MASAEEEPPSGTQGDAARTEERPPPTFGARPWGSLRNTLQLLSDWGDEFERTHFNGDFINAVSSAPRAVGERASRISEELGSAAAKLVEEAAGFPDQQDLFQPPPPDSAGVGVCGGSLPNPSSSSGPPADREPEAPPAGPAADPPPASSTAGPWEEAQRLQGELDHERTLRQGRAAALSALDESIRRMRAELVEERGLLEQTEGARMTTVEQVRRAERTLEGLQEEHDALQSRRTSQGADLRRHALAAAVAENIDRQLSRSGGWAREGPETEALKNAKVALAEALAEMDEVRLQSRREAALLQREIEAAQAESEQLQQWRAADQYVAPNSFRASVWRLVKIAGGGDKSRAADAERTLA